MPTVPDLVSVRVTTGNFNMQKPDGVQEGDLLIADVIGAGGSSSSPFKSAGWTALAGGSVSTVWVSSLLWKIAGPSEPASWPFVPSSLPTAVSGQILCVRGVDPSDPINVFSARKNTAATRVADSVTPTVADCLLLFLAEMSPASRGVGDPSDGMLRSQPAGTGSVSATLMAAEQALTDALATGSRSVSTTGGGSTADDHQSYLIAVAPVPNAAPNAPTLTTMAGGGKVARQDINRAAHTFSDPDAGDSQSAFRLRYRLVGAPAWTTLADQVTPSQFYDFPASSLTVGDYERQVQTADVLGVWGPWSTSGFFTVANRPTGATTLDPVPGATIPSDSYTLTISYPALDSWEVRVLGDLAGDPNPADVIVPLTVRPSTARTALLTDLPNGTTVHIEHRVTVDGLSSEWVTQSNPVSFTAPAVPTVALLADDATGSITITPTHPAPSGSEPAVQSVDVWRREGGSGAGIRIAAGLPASAAFVDRTPASGVDYAYRLTATGDNGTSSQSPWTS